MARVLLVIMMVFVMACGGKSPAAITTVPARVEPPVVISNVMPKISLTPRASVRITIRMAESPENRYLKVSMNGPLYYRGMTESWENEWMSPKIISFLFENVPEGRYVVEAVLLRSTGQKHLAHDTMCVAGPNTDCLE